MTLDTVSSFLERMADTRSGAWRLQDLKDLSTARLPDAVTARNDVILRADVHTLWLRWFVEGVCTPLRYVSDSSKNESVVYQEALGRINELFNREPKPAQENLAIQVAKHVMNEIYRQRNLARTSASIIVRRDLIDAGDPRCWICGYAFSQAAIDKFLHRESDHQVCLPELIDVLRPRGLTKKDVLIEVEHVVPVTAGGGSGDNLQLACGWCNRYKGARTSIYDINARPARINFNFGRFRLYELPHPFWTVRLPAVRQSCEHKDGCVATAKNSELFIAPVSCLGSPNPSNLQVFCEEHDIYQNDRFVARQEARRIWKYCER